jgi:S-DNA-T family DNA segregation ATPase FtsK/SpoIIIE
VLPPGRGFTDEALEFQVAVPLGHTGGDAVRAVASELAARYGDLRAQPLAVLPSRLALEDLPPAAVPLTATIAVEEDDHAPVALDVSEAHAVVAGPYRSGRTTALATIARGLRSSTPGLELHALIPRRRLLGERSQFHSVAIGTDQCVAAAAELAARVDARDPDEQHPPLVVLVDDGGELADSPAAGDALGLIVRRGRDVNVRVVMAIEVGTARQAYQPWIKELKKDGNGLLLDPDIDTDGDVLGVRLPRRRLHYPPGRGSHVDNGTLQLVQVAS